MNHFRKIIRVTDFFIKLGLGYCCALVFRFFNKSYRNLWLVSERGIDARDNGYFFYKFLRTVHPEINVCYVISSSSPDFNRISSIGRWVEHNSFKHYIAYAASTIRISSSMWGGDLPQFDYFFKVRKFMSHKRKFVFLKHGIVKDYLPQHCICSGKPDLYICGAKPEYDYVKDNFGHPNGVVKYTGLARFDNLHNFKTKEQILIMPTFRTWLQGKEEGVFSSSEYVSRWNAILSDIRLMDALKENNLELIFYPHHVFQRYVKSFKSSCNLVKIAKFKDYDVQQLLIESKLLITDYSSVFFDFGYMRKPVIYYQFDRKRYVENHYDFTKGYFSYDKDGFGPVVFEEDKLLEQILFNINSGFCVSQKYRERISKFFTLNDAKNCERIFNEIKKIENEEN